MGVEEEHNNKKEGCAAALLYLCDEEMCPVQAGEKRLNVYVYQPHAPSSKLSRISAAESTLHSQKESLKFTCRRRAALIKMLGCGQRQTAFSCPHAVYTLRRERQAAECSRRLEYREEKAHRRSSRVAGMNEAPGVCWEEGCLGVTGNDTMVSHHKVYMEDTGCLGRTEWEWVNA